jgi:tetratricopeptide (TPR) repeat protein
MPTRTPSSSSFRFAIGLAAALAAAGCASSSGKQPGPGTPAPPPVQYDMEPIRIDATKGPAGLQIEAYDAPELFEQGDIALAEKRHDDAARLYAKLLHSFPDSRYSRPALYNLGLAHTGRHDWAAAVAAFQRLADKYPSHADARDALFQLGACHAELGNWSASGEVFARILERSDLTADDRIEAIARRGFAQFNLGDLDAAEITFRAVQTYRKRIESDERLGTDFYLAFSQYHLAHITHRRFQAIELRLPEAQMDRDLDEKARLLLQAQRGYIETIKLGNPAWASAAGFQAGSLYEELHDAFMRAPVPPELEGEAREVYMEELNKKIRVLLDKSMRIHRSNLLMIERLGANTDWAEKSRAAYAKLLKLLEPRLPGAAPAPTSRPDAAAASDSISPAPAVPPTPAPPRRAEPPAREEPADADSVRRQIL